MAEAVAAISLAASLLQLVEFGGKVVHRLHEFQSNINDVPEVFRDIMTRLPLLIDTLEQTQQVDGAHPSERTAKALKPVVDACLSQISLLDEILKKHIPKEGDSVYRKSLKALSSLAHDKDIQKINIALEGHVQTLTYYTSNQVLRTTFQQMKLGSDPLPRKPVFMVKFDHDNDFIGRDDMMKEIDERYRNGQHRVAIAGIGGVGYRARQPDGHVFWVHASNHARFREGYSDIARELALPNHSREDSLQLVPRWLNNDANGPWLLILDNADDSDTFFRSNPLQQAAPLVNYLPKSSNGFIVITTRDMRVGENLANRMKPISVLPLAVVEAQGLLKSKCHPGDEEKIGNEALELLEILNYLPLAITQAAAFINENGRSVADYVEMLKASVSDVNDLLEEDLHDAGRDKEIQNSVFQTWKISYDHIQKQKPRAAEMLAIMSLLDRQAIPAELLRHDNERKVDFVTAIGMLKAFSLISEEKNQFVFGIHRLVQLSIQRWLEIRKQLDSWQEKALEVVAKCCPPDGSYEKWTSWSKISAHCQTVLGYNIKTRRQLRAKILNSFGNYDKAQGRYRDAEEKVTEAYAINKNMRGKHHALTLMTMSHLSSIYQHQGRYEEAEQMCSYMVQTRKQLLGPEHSLTLDAINNLGTIYSEMNRYVEAGELYRLVLDTRKRVLGSDSDHILVSMHNLATNMNDQGQLKEAEGMLEEVIKLSSTVRGPEHPETLTSMHNLGLNYQDQGLWEKAAELYHQMCETRRKTLGLEHPDTLHSMLKVAAVYQLRLQLEAAEELQLQVMKKRESILGHEHRETLLAAKELALTYVGQGRWEEAASLHANVLEIEKRVLRLDHDDTIATMHDIAFSYRCQERWQEAADLGMQVVTARNRTLRQDKPETLLSMINLARAYEGLNRAEDAPDLMVAVAAGRTKTLGVDHPDTQRSINLVKKLTRMRDNPTQPTPDPSSGIRTDIIAPEAADGSKDPIPSSQFQLLGQSGHVPESSSEPHPNSGNTRKERISASQGEPSEQTLHVPEDLHTITSASDVAAEKTVPAHEIEPSERNSPSMA